MTTLKRRMMLIAVASAFALTIATALPASAAAPTVEYFTVTQTSMAGPQTIVAVGPIAATGTDTKLGSHRDTWMFPAGTLTVRHEPLTEKQTFDSRSCAGTFTETGTYVLARGTGDYAHTTGSGTYKATGTFAGCDRNAPPTAFAIVIQAHGPVTLG